MNYSICLKYKSEKSLATYLSFLKKSTSAQLDFWKEKKFNKMILKSSVRINVGAKKTFKKKYKGSCLTSH